jgi:hypothetical protein
MKHLFFSLIATIITSLLGAQTVTLQFVGVNKNRNYQVVIDGTTYSSAEAVGNSKSKMVTMTNLLPGSHSLALYPAGSTVSAGNALYSNTFQLREGYDMDIVVSANGAVSFTEMRNNQTAVSSGSYNAAMAMSEEDFERLSRSVRSKLLQPSRVSSLRSTFNTPTNFFTTDQIGQLIAYVNSEPTRLDLAKAAYARVIDSANYRTLYDLFRNESLRSELDFFLRNTTITPGATTGSGTSAITIPVTTDTAAKTRTNAKAGSNRDENAASKSSTHADNKEAVGSKAGVEADASPIANERRTAGREKVEKATATPAYNNRPPVSNRSFNQLVRRVKNQRGQQAKVTVLKNAFESGSNYYTTVQLRQLLTPVAAEADRLVLAKLAYPRTADTANFKNLYDLLKDRYSQLELDHFVRFGNVGTTVTTDAANSKYAHRAAISETDYANLDLKVRFHLRQANTIADIRKAFTSNHYFTAEQIRQWLNLVTAESDRLALAKLAYLRISNPNTFTSLYDLFPSQESKDELDRYMAANKF